ncbi:hypothetical protein F6464_11585 [Flavobacterium luteum]|uniref:DUF5683 domain-containing protein n=1 Tax=Flavobacterium luteum TaxID=2026654 RepID=A0A7J5ABZ1_9FLAO|nr:hypothetical protein F6464_11585 [Flavobacterium luteum]
MILLLLFGSCLVDAQVLPKAILQSKDTVKSKEINPLSPAKAAFFSAVLPGLGQAYNKKYWKIPLVYGAMGTSLYYYSVNNKKYHDFRDAYKSRLAGFTNDKYQYLDDSRLITAQRFYQRNRDMSLLLTAAFYILNIVDANIDAHLLQFNVNDNLTLNPKIEQNDINFRTTFGLALNMTFK